MTSKPGFKYFESGKTLYAQIRSSIGQIWNTVSSQYEDFNESNIVNYKVPVTEQGVSAYYLVDVPDDIVDGYAFIDAFVQATGAPLWTDMGAATGTFFAKLGILFNPMPMYKTAPAGIQFTEQALELAPTGGGGGGEGSWSEAELRQIRFRLGVDGDIETPVADPDLSQFHHDKAEDLAKFATIDTGETAPVKGSVAELSRARITLDLEPGYGTDYLKTPLCIVRGDTFALDFNLNLDATGGLVEIWVTFKGSVLDPDTESYFQITQTEGLKYLLSEDAAEPTNGSVVLIQENPAIVRVVLAAEASAVLPVKKDDLWFDLQVKTTQVKTPVIGKAQFVGDVTRNIV